MLCFGSKKKNEKPSYSIPHALSYSGKRKSMNLKSKTKFGFIKLKAGFPPVYHPVTDGLLA